MPSQKHQGQGRGETAGEAVNPCSDQASFPAASCEDKGTCEPATPAQAEDTLSVCQRYHRPSLLGGHDHKPRMRSVLPAPMTEATPSAAACTARSEAQRQPGWWTAACAILSFLSLEQKHRLAWGVKKSFLQTSPQTFSSFG